MSGKVDKLLGRYREKDTGGLPIQETDPIFTASPAATITASDIATWVHSSNITEIIALTQVEYDAIVVPLATTLYFIIPA